MNRITAGGIYLIHPSSFLLHPSVLSPREGDRGFDVGVQALMNGGGVSGGLEALLIFFAELLRHVHGHGEAADAADRGGDHFLGDLGGCAGDVEVVALGDDPHGGEDAGGQRGGDQVGGREGLPLAHVVLRRVGGEGAAAGAVGGGGWEWAGVDGRGFNHCAN